MKDGKMDKKMMENDREDEEDSKGENVALLNVVASVLHKRLLVD